MDVFAAAKIRRQGTRADATKSMCNFCVWCVSVVVPFPSSLFPFGSQRYCNASGTDKLLWIWHKTDAKGVYYRGERLKEREAGRRERQKRKWRRKRAEERETIWI